MPPEPVENPTCPVHTSRSPGSAFNGESLTLVKPGVLLNSLATGPWEAPLLVAAAHVVLPGSFMFRSCPSTYDAKLEQSHPPVGLDGPPYTYLCPLYCIASCRIWLPDAVAPGVLELELEPLELDP